MELAKEGAAVVFHYSQSSSGADSAVDEVLKAGGKAKAIKADFRLIEPVSEGVCSATRGVAARAWARDWKVTTGWPLGARVTPDFCAAAAAACCAWAAACWRCWIGCSTNCS